MNVPKLRFPEFHGEWSKKTLKEISSEITYGMNSASKTFDGINKYIRITDIDDESSRFKTDNLVSPSNKLDNNFLVKENDILFARTGASTGKTYLYNSEDGKLYYAGFLIKANIIKHNAYFIFQQTKLEKYKKWVKLTSVRSGQPGINSKEYGKYSFSTTVLREENKIGLFFSLLDKKIELQSKKVEALKLFKSGIKNKIMNINCNPVLLGSIIKKWNLKNKKNTIKYIESISNKYGFISQKEQFDERKIASADLSNYYIIKKNVFAYNPSRLDVGSLALKKDSHISVISPLYVCFTTKENNEYLLEWFNSKYFKREIYSKFEGGVRNTLNFNSLSSAKIKIPNLNEQNKIANFLKEFNKKIDIESDKLDKLNKLKKGLMQNMFV